MLLFALCINVNVCVCRFLPLMLSVYFYVFTCGCYVCVGASDEQYRVVFIDGRHGARRHFLCLLIINQLVLNLLLFCLPLLLSISPFLFLSFYLVSLFPLFLCIFFCSLICSLPSSSLLFPFLSFLFVMLHPSLSTHLFFHFLNSSLYFLCSCLFSFLICYLPSLPHLRILSSISPLLPPPPLFSSSPSIQSVEPV